MVAWPRGGHGRLRKGLATPLLATAFLLVAGSGWPASDDDSSVDIPDSSLRAAIMSALGKEPDASVTVAEMRSLSDLDAVGVGIADLTGLEYATSLIELRLGYNWIADVAPLADLPNLSWLELDGNRIVDVAPLGGLPSLRYVYLNNNQIADITELADLPALSHLSLDGNRIEDITPLAGTQASWLDTVSLAGNRIVDVTPLAANPTLRQLSLDANEISDIGPLAELRALDFLSLYENRVADIAPLAALQSLRRLWLGYNKVANIAPLADLTALEHLLLPGNQISDITPLAGLRSLRWLLLNANRIADAGPLADLTNLELLDLGNNRIEDITPLASLTSLRTLGVAENQIADLSALATLTSLTVLWLGGNRIVDIQPVASLTGLVELRLGNNLISDLRPLDELGDLDQLGLGDNEVDDLSPLAGVTSLSALRLFGNAIEDLGPLVENQGLRRGELVHVWGNPLSNHSRDVDVPTLESRGVRVIHTGHEVPYLPRAADAGRQGFVRIVNREARPYLAGSRVVWLRATDDSGQAGPAPYVLLAKGLSSHFNSDDLESGNASKGLSRGVGAGQGGWRLEFYPEIDVEVSAYLRTDDGFLTPMNALAPRTARGYRVVTFNPGSNLAQVSILRLANPGHRTASVTVRGVDDHGSPSVGEVRLELHPGEARMLTAQQLETGDGLVGALGDGVGKWRLEVSTDAPIQAMSLLESPTGHLTNLSSVPDNAEALADGRTRHRVPYFPAADDARGRQGFARVVNEHDAPAAVVIEAFDDTGKRYGPTTLAIPPSTTAHFNSHDLEVGNADKGLPSGIGSGAGAWRLELATGDEIRVLVYLRTVNDGFLTAMHDTVDGVADGVDTYLYEVAIFNPASNLSQVSQLRVINDGAGAAEVTVTGIDDHGRVSAGPTHARFALASGQARTVTAQQLESGDGLTGGLGDGTGKWRLLVRSSQALQLVNLLSSPTGHLSNLSGARRRYEP